MARSGFPAASLTPGTLVLVTGRVLEFVPAANPTSAPLTEIAESPTIVVRGSGMSLPAPQELRADDDTLARGPETLERFEGMRVRVASLTASSGTLGAVSEANATGSSNGVFYGVVTGVARPFRSRGIDVTRQALPADAPCCVPVNRGNPELLRVDSDGQPGAPAINLTTGSVVRNLVGPLDYGFRSYTILPDPATPLEQNADRAEPKAFQDSAASPVARDGESARTSCGNSASIAAFSRTSASYSASEIVGASWS